MSGEQNPVDTAAAPVSLAPSVQQLDVNGTTLAFRESGQGDPIVLVHGNISDMRTWNPLETRLARQFRVIVYSRRYAWPNTPMGAEDDDPWDVQADDLEALITKLELSPTHVVGNSAGSSIALLLARRRPELFRTLILEEPPVVSIFLPSNPPTLTQVLSFLWRHPWDFLPIVKCGAMVIQPTISAFKRGENEKALEILVRGVMGDEYYDEISEERLEQMRQNLAPHRALLLGSELPSFSEDDAGAILVPTLFLTGQKTAQFQKSISRRLTELMPDAEEIFISNASHLMHEDNPDATAHEIVGFIDALRLSPRRTE